MQPALTAAASSFVGFTPESEVPKDPSNETVRDLRIIFAVYEHPTRSTITIAQLKEILELMGGPPPDMRGVERRLASHNIGEHLNFKNFVTFFINHVQAPKSTALHPKEIFRYIDADDSGELSCTELQEALAKMGMVLSADETSAMVNAVEGPADGLISYQEFKKLYRQVDEIREARNQRVNSNSTGSRSKRNRMLHIPGRNRTSQRGLMATVTPNDT